LAQVNPDDAGKACQCRFQGNTLQQFFGTLPGFDFGAAHDRLQAEDHLELAFITVRGGGGTQLIHGFEHARKVRLDGKDDLGVLHCKLHAAAGGTGLEAQRPPPLGRQRRAHRLTTEVLALVVHRCDFVRVGELASGLVHQNRIVGNAVPQAVANLHELVGLVIALIVWRLRAQPAGQLLGRAEPAHNVPADTPATEVVERRDSARGEIRGGAGGRERDTDAQVRGGGGHRGHQWHRVVVGPGHTMLYRRHGTAFVHGVRGRAVGKKDAVETAALQGARHVLPVGEVLQAIELAVLGVGPAHECVGGGSADQHLHQVHF